MKLGLVLEGGGMKCAYGAAILDRLMDEGISFPYVIGVSAGASNAASFLAGQRGRNYRFYTEHIRKPDYFGIKPLLTSGGIFGISYIYGTLSNSDGEDPLDYPAILRNPASYTMVATDAETGRAHYFHKEDLAQNDYRPIMASCSIPVMSRPVEIGGRYYYDGGVSDAIPVRHAIEEGCERLVVILSKTRDFIRLPQKHRPIYRLALAKYPAMVRAVDRRHIMYGHVQRQVFNLERHGRAFVFAPSAKLPMGTYDVDVADCRALYELGLQDFEARLGELKAFVGADGARAQG